MTRIAPDALEALAAAALERAGASPPMAQTSARYLVLADLQGIGTHGVARVPQYASHLRAGRVKGDAVPRVAREKGAACLIDAGDGLAFPACARAAAEATARARAHGIGIGATCNSHHSGAIAAFLLDAAAAGFVGLGFSNAGAAIVPWGGSKPLFGTNPVAAVFPVRGGDPVVIDLSMTQVTRGTIMLLAKQGKPVPEGWGMDADGRPTTDPQRILVGGSLNAVGGMKGTVLALVVQLLTSALTGAALSQDIPSVHEAEGPPFRQGQCFVVIDPGALVGADAYFDRVQTLVAAMLADEGVRLPGARRFAAAAAARRDGLDLSAALLQELRTLAGTS